VKRLTIPLPEPVFMVTLTNPSGATRRVEANAIRFLAWLVPSFAVDYVLASADGGRHSLLLTLAASFTVLAIAVLTVNVEEAPAPEEAPADAREEQK
jgi:hypothetical protein